MQVRTRITTVVLGLDAFISMIRASSVRPRTADVSRLSRVIVHILRHRPIDRPTRKWIDDGREARPPAVPVRIQGTSPARCSFGLVAVKSRSTRSGTGAAFGSGTVVRLRRRWWRPWVPTSRIRCTTFLRSAGPRSAASRRSPRSAVTRKAIRDRSSWGEHQVIRAILELCAVLAGNYHPSHGSH